MATLRALLSGPVAVLCLACVGAVAPVPLLGQDLCALGTAECSTDAATSKLEVERWVPVTNFGRYSSLHGTLSLTDNLCVAAKDGLYTVTFSSAQGGNGFAMWGGGFTNLPYHVAYSAGGTFVEDAR